VPARPRAFPLTVGCLVGFANLQVPSAAYGRAPASQRKASEVTPAASAPPVAPDPAAPAAAPAPDTVEPALVVAPLAPLPPATFVPAITPAQPSVAAPMNAPVAAVADPGAALAAAARAPAPSEAPPQTEPAKDELVELNRTLLSGKGLGTQLRAQTGIVHRALHFTQDVYDRLRTLQTNLYVVRVDASVYPTFEASVISGRLGLIGGFEAAFAGSVQDANFGHEYPASYSEFFGGLRGRYPLQQHLIGFELTVDRLNAGLTDPRRAAGVPDVAYTDLRSSLDFTLGVERLRASAAAGFRVPLSYGEIEQREWFPRLGGYALEGSLAASYLVRRGVALEFSTSLRRFVLEMNSQPEDSQEGVSEVAGGAVDSYVGAYLGVSVSL
jgi:hypothetical protein